MELRSAPNNFSKYFLCKKIKDKYRSRLQQAEYCDTFRVTVQRESFFNSVHDAKIIEGINYYDTQEGVLQESIWHQKKMPPLVARTTMRGADTDSNFKVKLTQVNMLVKSLNLTGLAYLRLHPLTRINFRVYPPIEQW